MSVRAWPRWGSRPRVGTAAVPQWWKSPLVYKCPPSCLIPIAAAEAKRAIPGGACLPKPTLAPLTPAELIHARLGVVCPAPRGSRAAARSARELLAPLCCWPGFASWKSTTSARFRKVVKKKVKAFHSNIFMWTLKGFHICWLQKSVLITGGCGTHWEFRHLHKTELCFLAYLFQSSWFLRQIVLLPEDSLILCEWSIICGKKKKKCFISTYVSC